MPPEPVKEVVHPPTPTPVRSAESKSTEPAPTPVPVPPAPVAEVAHPPTPMPAFESRRSTQPTPAIYLWATLETGEPTPYLEPAVFNTENEEYESVNKDASSTAAPLNAHEIDLTRSMNVLDGDGGDYLLLCK